MREMREDESCFTCDKAPARGGSSTTASNRLSSGGGERMPEQVPPLGAYRLQAGCDCAPQPPAPPTWPLGIHRMHLRFPRQRQRECAAAAKQIGDFPWPCRLLRARAPEARLRLRASAGERRSAAASTRILTEPDFRRGALVKQIGACRDTDEVEASAHASQSAHEFRRDCDGSRQSPDRSRCPLPACKGQRLRPSAGAATSSPHALREPEKARREHMTFFDIDKVMRARGMKADTCFAIFSLRSFSVARRREHGGQ